MSTALFSELKIKTIVFKNRIAVSPMCQYSAQNGFANQWHLVHLGCRAIGGAGLIIQEATAIAPEGRITNQDLGIWSDDHIEKFSEITDFIRSQNSIPGIQIAHAGRKASITPPWKGNIPISANQGGWTTVGPSAIGYHNETNTVALDVGGIDQVISDFASAAKRSLAAGYQVLEIHAAHGYLLHQFLSPLSNKRSDAYGGSFENRCRLLLEVIEAVQSEWPATLPLFVRISATDWAPGGWNLSDSVQLAKILKNSGVDLIDVSSGGLVSHQEIETGPLYQVPFAEQIKKNAHMLTAAVGMITQAQQAEEILQQNKADMIFFGRESLRNPNLPLDFAEALDAEIDWPEQYERAKK
ncbi:MAG: NADH:flavin oxidoreductase/NADH oxidase [Flavobacterium sp.]|nr:NADH:flavin oxidoreductase/NADH oxidase [Flavobacterium sp.]